MNFKKEYQQYEEYKAGKRFLGFNKKTYRYVLKLYRKKRD